MNVGFLVSFSAGVVSVISPCVLPLIPILIGHSLLQRELKETVAFTLGFFLVFTFITVSTVIFTAAINYYLLYFRVAAALVLIGIGVLLIVNKNLFKFSYAPEYRKGAFGSFLVGFLTCIAWSPCFGPYLAAVAAYSASTGNFIYSALNMILFASGFSLAVFAIAFLASRVDFKGLIQYSEWIRIFSGVIIIVAGFYMLWILF